MRKRKGFTLVELLVVVSIIALLISILLPTLGRAKELTRQVMCSANLSGIGKAWKLYGAENDDQPPILPDINQNTADYAQALQFGRECTAAELGTGAQQNLCLLVKGNFVGWKMFLCPSTGKEPLERSQDDNLRYGLGGNVDGVDKTYCDYGIQIPYDHVGMNKCPLTSNMDGAIAILGDTGPDPADGDLNRDWSPNHPKDGESLLYVAGNVKFSRDKNDDDDKNTGGWGGNNVYTRDSWDTSDPYDEQNPHLNHNGSSPGWPASTKDSVLWSWRP